ncbi:MAG: isopeptide-forming domain-containing fimbrial protein, partial [Ilumatobacteraceae bacterium]
MSCTGAQVTHPLTGILVPCPTGRQLVVIQLPFGSFTPDQPVAHVTVVANVSSLADVGTGLAVTATPGFAYGNSPTGNTPIAGTTKSITYVPQVVRFTKTYVGPELETATGPNYPRNFRLSVDVATGQTIQNLTVTDRLPKQYAYLSIVGQSAATNAVATPLVGAPSTLQNTLTRTFSSNVVGTSSNEDAFVEFQYFIPDTDAASATIVDHSTGDDVATTNDGEASGTFVPSDIRDAAQPFTINPNTTIAPYNDNVIMTAKSIAIQKSVTDLTHAQSIPGDTLSYTLDGQVSDYFTFNNVVVDDVLGDGQSFDASFVPVLQVTEAGASYTVPVSYTVDASQRAGCGSGELGTTHLHFDVSGAYAAQDPSGNGVLTGGRVNGATTGPATYRIVFHTTVDDAYVCKPTPNNPLDPRDAIGNAVTTTGEVFDNATQAAQAAPQYETDDSGTQVTMAPTALEKSIWARNGVVGSVGSPAKFAANDTITYEFTMHLPSSDVANLSLDDYLPLPVLKASALTQGANCTVSTAPALGQWCYGPNDTFHTVSPAAPAFSFDATSNSLSWLYGTRELTDNQPRDIQIMFTSKISDDPFRDGLFLTNQVQSSETNSLNPTVYVAPAIVQIVLTEPSLKIRKGIVATSVQAPVATFSGTKNPTGITFKPVGDTSCTSVSGGPLTSTSLANGGPNANVTGLDAGDLVRFAVVVENTGTGANGAFDTTISDAVPAGFRVPSSGLNLCITNGAGTVLGATKTGFFNGLPTTDPLGSGTIELTDGATGALASASPTTGTNVAVITYDLQLVPTTGANTTAASLTNTATITNYAGDEGGPSFVPITPAANLTDTATVATKPITISKSLITTDQASTTGSNVAIGEQVQYQVTVTIPEGVSRNVAVVDTLPAGLAISQAPGAATIGSSLSASGVIAPVIGANGSSVRYTFGDITNGDADNTTTANETITMTYWAVVLDIMSNQSATKLN